MAASLGTVEKRGLEMLLAEVGPKHGGDVDLAVGGLPEGEGY